MDVGTVLAQATEGVGGVAVLFDLTLVTFSLLPRFPAGLPGGRWFCRSLASSSFAALARMVAKAVMTGVGVSPEFLRNEDLDKVRGNLTSDRGLGQTLIVRFLDGIPGINDGVVQL